MTSEERRLADAAAFGRRLAEESCAAINKLWAEHQRIMVEMNNYAAAQRIVQATGGSAQDVLRIAFEAGSTPIEYPRPRLVLVK